MAAMVMCTVSAVIAGIRRDVIRRLQTAAVLTRVGAAGGYDTVGDRRAPARTMKKSGKWARRRP
jgi:hypothetical protein